MAVATSRDPHARRLKPQATGCESRLRGLIEPASAGFVDVAEGFSPTASDFATAAPVGFSTVARNPPFCYTTECIGPPHHIHLGQEPRAEAPGLVEVIHEPS